MDELLSLSCMQEQLLNLSNPLAAFDLPLLDAHGACLANNLVVDERVVIKRCQRIDSTQIALAASLGLDKLPCQPQPRVVIISAGDDLVEPGSKLANDQDEYESNSWFLTTFVREAGAHAFRVHTIPETQNQLKLIVEDQLVRADLIVISGESKDESFDLITSVLLNLGEIKIVTPNLAESSKHCYGVIGPDKTPVVVLPGDPIGNYLSAELFIRPMISKMLNNAISNRKRKKVKLSNDLKSQLGKVQFLRGLLSDDGQVSVLVDQDSLITLAMANCLIEVDEQCEKLSIGDQVNIVMVD
jgi:molybdopterin biosynthesis enzyme